MEELSGISPRDKTRGPKGIAPGFLVEVRPHTPASTAILPESA